MATRRPPAHPNPSYSDPAATAPDCPTTGKRSFRSKAAARRFTRRRNDLHRAYRCEHCDLFHLTSSARRMP